MTVELSQEQKDQLVGGGECFLHSHTPDQITGLVELVLQEVPGPIPPGTYLVPANNLSDVASIVTTLTNLGLDQVDNTSDLAKPVSTATSAALSGKANVAHSHVIGDVTGLQTALDGKAASSHTHTIANVTGLQTSLDGKLYNYTTTTTGTSKTLANRERCTVTAAGQTITLPASPAAGWEVSISVGAFVNTTVARNSQNIMGLAENMAIDKANVTVTLFFVDATRGWRII